MAEYTDICIIGKYFDYIAKCIFYERHKQSARENAGGRKSVRLKGDGGTQNKNFLFCGWFVGFSNRSEFLRLCTEKGTWNVV